MMKWLRLMKPSSLGIPISLTKKKSNKWLNLAIPTITL